MYQLLLHSIPLLSKDGEGEDVHNRTVDKDYHKDEDEDEDKDNHTKDKRNQDEDEDVEAEGASKMLGEMMIGMK